MLGSCSSSDDLNGGGNNTGFNENGDGFVAVAINLPTTKSTPSRVNDDFKDGTADEYEVKNAKLLLFNGTDEASATFVQAYPLTLGSGVAVMLISKLRLIMSKQLRLVVLVLQIISMLW